MYYTIYIKRTIRVVSFLMNTVICMLGYSCHVVEIVFSGTNQILVANNESSEVFDIIKPGRRVKLNGYRQ